jgi:hypothetical protein
MERKEIRLMAYYSAGNGLKRHAPLSNLIF